MLHHFKMIQSRVSNTRRTYCVEPVCKWFSVLKNMCMFQSVYRQIVPIFVWWTEQHLKWKKKKQEARKIAIITEHTQFFYSYFFSSFLFKTKQNKNQHRNFVDQTPSFVYLHSWHWVALVVVVVAVAIIVAAVARPTQQDAYTQTHIVGVSLMATN